MTFHTPIKIYYHVSLIGKYFDITLRIFHELEQSGLYSKCESISVGALGSKSELPNLQEILDRYPKAKIIAHNKDTQYFEFFTLEHLKRDADELPNFYALYLHSKGVTSENENDALFRQFWCDHMVYWMVTKWKKCYHALDLKDLDDYNVGYDVCSVRVVPKRKSIGHSTHGSGNFWWANSEYIKTLPLVLADTYYDGQNKYMGGHSAETFLWQEQPIIYTPCQMFQIGFPFDKGMTFKEYWKQLPNKRKYLL